MVDGSIFIPLSPPTSPRMSGYNGETEWQNHELKHLEPLNTGTSDGDMVLMHAEVSGLALDLHRRPALLNHKSYPYTLGRIGQQPNTPTDSSETSPAPHRERITVSDIESTTLPTEYTGGSAPASPVSRLTPPSPSGDMKADFLDDMAGDSALEGTGTDNEEESKPPTAAELRAQKRKMKRFRLTHNQTRFLMSEFARQAHPDAAHRERLAREIPGLSPRQVQVWFQNRRAKLKRLTSDDRERMMRSRALPDDFDMAQALHSPFTAGHPLGTPLASPASYAPTFPDAGMIRPLSIDTLRRGPEGLHLSPTGISPAFGGFAFTPPHSATDPMSPISAGPDGGHFTYPPGPMDSSPRRNPFNGSVSAAPSYTSHPQIPRLSLHDRIARTRAESMSNPLRPTLGFTSAGSTSSNDSGMHSLDGALSDDNSRGSPSILPYGLGYSYSHQIQGFQAGAASRMRSFSGTMPRRIELSTHYTHHRSATTPQTATFPNFTSQISAAQNFQVPHLSAPHNITSFPNSYLRQDHGASDQYHTVGAVLGEVVESSPQDGDDTNENSVQLSQHY